MLCWYQALVFFYCIMGNSAQAPSANAVDQIMQEMWAGTRSGVWGDVRKGLSDEIKKEVRDTSQKIQDDVKKSANGLLHNNADTNRYSVTTLETTDTTSASKSMSAMEMLSNALSTVVSSIAGALGSVFAALGDAIAKLMQGTDTDADPMKVTVQSSTSPELAETQSPDPAPAEPAPEDSTAVKEKKPLPGSGMAKRIGDMGKGLASTMKMGIGTIGNAIQNKIGNANQSPPHSLRGSPQDQQLVEKMAEEELPLKQSRQGPPSQRKRSTQISFRVG